MNTRLILAIIALIAVVFSPVGVSADTESKAGPAQTMETTLNNNGMAHVAGGYAKQGATTNSAIGPAVGQASNGTFDSGGGGQGASTQALQTAPMQQKATNELTNNREVIGQNREVANTGTTGQTIVKQPSIALQAQQVDAELNGDFMEQSLDREGNGAQTGQISPGVSWSDSSTPVAILMSITGGGGCLPGGVDPASPGGCEGGAGGFEPCKGGGSKPGMPGGLPSIGQMSASKSINAKAAASNAADPQGNGNASSCSKGECSGSQASAAAEDALLNAFCAFDVFGLPLINVANENAAAKTTSSAPTKSYANVIYMVQQMYKNCYIPMAILFLLPGALITNTKTLVSFGIIGSKDEDGSSPFAGIMRAMIAIFLIPATQLAVSYLIDVGNSLQDCTKDYVSLPLILLWAHEQAQTFTPEQQGQLIKNLPVVSGAPYLGKFAGMPVAGAMLEQLGGMHIALAELCNEMMHMLSIGLCVISAFQLVMACYLFLMGPLAAAFFAWPSVGRDLFRKAFSTWLDGMVVLSLWKFWWTIVLCCMTARLQAGFINPFDPFEVYYFIAFMCILLVVPFNPFDFKAGELVTMVLMKAEGVAAKVAQGGKGGGSGGKPAGKSCG